MLKTLLGRKKASGSTEQEHSGDLRAGDEVLLLHEPGYAVELREASAGVDKRIVSGPLSIVRTPATDPRVSTAPALLRVADKEVPLFVKQAVKSPLKRVDPWTFLLPSTEPHSAFYLVFPKGAAPEDLSKVAHVIEYVEAGRAVPEPEGAQPVEGGPILFERHGLSTGTAIQLTHLEKAVGNFVLGSCLVRNLGFQKSVFLRYSISHWQDYREVEANWDKQVQPDVDSFTFVIDLPAALAEHPSEVRPTLAGHRVDLSFALRYHVKGKDYWDNNGGGNYNFQITLQ